MKATDLREMTALQPWRLSQVARFGEISLDFKRMELWRADHRVGLTLLDFKRMELWRADHRVGLTLLEFKVLRFFVFRPELVVSRQKLITAIWPKRRRSSNRTVDNHIARLRQKIEKDPAHPVYLQTVYGVGYKFVPQEKSDPLWQGKAEHVTDEH